MALGVSKVWVVKSSAVKGFAAGRVSSIKGPAASKPSTHAAKQQFKKFFMGKFI